VERHGMSERHRGTITALDSVVPKLGDALLAEDGASFDLGQAPPDAVRLSGPEGELEALFAHDAAGADPLCFFFAAPALSLRLGVVPAEEEDCGTVEARGLLPPLAVLAPGIGLEHAFPHVCDGSRPRCARQYLWLEVICVSPHRDGARKSENRMRR
jgi:hypothetical protein